MERFELINTKSGQIEAYFQIEKTSNVTVKGKIKEVYAWEEDGSPFLEHLFAEAYIKWDGCSHFNFYGEDYLRKDIDGNIVEEKPDSYYHLCGIGSYIKFMTLLSFAYEVMVRIVGEENILEELEYQSLMKIGLLNGYKIRINHQL